MPNIKSAEKELRKGKKRAKRNLNVELDLKKLVKKSLRAIQTDDSKAEELVLKTLKAFDKAAKKGVIKKNTRDRKKSKLHQKLNDSKKAKK